VRWAEFMEDKHVQLPMVNLDPARHAHGHGQECEQKHPMEVEAEPNDVGDAASVPRSSDASSISAPPLIHPPTLHKPLALLEPPATS